MRGTRSRIFCKFRGFDPFLEKMITAQGEVRREAKLNDVPRLFLECRTLLLLLQLGNLDGVIQGRGPDQIGRWPNLALPKRGPR